MCLVAPPRVERMSHGGLWEYGGHASRGVGDV